MRWAEVHHGGRLANVTGTLKDSVNMHKAKMAILVIEDHLADAGVILKMLSEDRNHAFSVEHVQSLAEGLALLQSRDFDCVLLDLGLPDSQGLETALALRRQSKRLPIVVLTARDDEQEAMRSLQLDIQDYLVKGEICGGLLTRSVRYAIHRKRSADQLWDSEQRFAAFMRHMPAAAWIKDLQGRYLYANAEAERVLSTPLADLLGKTDREALPPETAQRLDRNHSQIASEGGSLQTTEALRQADGIEHHFIVNRFAVTGPDGQPAYVAGAALDITQRMRLEAELEHFASFPLLNPTPIMELDYQGKVIFCNSAAEQMLGKARCLDSNNPLIPADLRDILRDLQQGRTVWCARTVEVGELAFEEMISLAPGFDSVRIYAVDVTERKRLEADRNRLAEALRESEERLRLAVESTGLGTFDYYPQTEVMIWSDGVRRHFGLPPGAYVDFGVFLAGLHPEDRERVVGIVEQLRNPMSGGEYNTEYRAIGRQDGKERWIAARGQVFYDEKGEAFRCVGITLDISARKQAEQKIEELYSALAARAAELAAANQELEAFNYTVTHDLRQPLNLISGYCQMIKELCGDKLDAPCQGYLQDTYKGTLRMNQLIEALLRFSRVANIELNREQIDLSTLAKEVNMELRQVHLKRRVTVTIAEGLSACCDAKLMRVVLDNLFGNAWKYTGSREEAVVEFGALASDAATVYFVRDNGAGFDMADADKLFLPFRRLPGVEEFKGFGIGLATADRIIRRHGGRLWAEGEPDRGATFYFTLPEN